MTLVIKRDGKKQAFKSSKIVKACKGAGIPELLAKTIALIITRKIKGKKEVRSTDIKKMIFDMFETINKAKKHWENYKK